MDELIKDFEKSLFMGSTDIVGEYVELGIDSFINDGILKDLPIVNSIVAVLKTGKNIHDRNLLKQTITFINEFNSNNISPEKLNKYKTSIENNPKKCEDELSRIMLLLNKFIDKEKSVLLAKLFKGYVNEIINWKEFCEYSEVIDRLFLQDLELLKEIYYKKVNITKGRDDMYRVERLNSLGVIALTMASMSISNGKSRTDSYIVLADFGKKFMDVLIK
ncbi:MAG: hypothetical protein J6A89_05450 [Clostridia bacterium]|nr:hypothetical protein [Clostridia bacterium]